MRWRLAVLGLAAYLIALVLTAPAGLLDAQLAGASSGRLRLSEATGRLWSGAGHLEMRGSNGRGLVGEGLRWCLLPGGLARGVLAFELQPEHSQSFVFAVGWRGIEIASAEFVLPATALAALQPKLAALQPSGEVGLSVRQLAISRSGWTGVATLQWHEAGSSLTPISPLGDYALQLEGAGDAMKLKLISRKGPLRLEGSGSLERGGKLTFVAVARIDPEFRTALAPFLRLIAVERGDGSFELQLE